MKTKIMTILMALITMVLFAQCDKDDDNINPSDLPEVAQNFLKTNYPNKDYTVEKESKNGKVVYEVDIVGNIDVEFDGQGKCTYVGGRISEIPNEVVDSQIRTYVSDNYPNVRIVEWEMEDTYQEVELSNNIELIFDLENKFLYSRRDDDDDDEIIIGENELPTAARTFITTHFPDVTITTLTKEMEHGTIEYEAILANAFELDFDAAGNCISIDGSMQRIPDGALNSKIVNYVSVNYTNTFIRDWDLDTRNQEVELRNGLELTFDLEGNFLYVDND